MSGDEHPPMLSILLSEEPSRLRQLNRHTGDSPADMIGDCFRTSIACLLGYSRPDYVPHFVEETIRAGLDEHGGWEDIAAARRWLRSAEELDLAFIDRDEADRLGCPYQVTVRSHSGPWNHSVVGQRGEVVWCPTTGDAETKHPGAYTMRDALEDVVLVVCHPYEPDPDAMLAQWRFADATAMNGAA